MKKITLYHGSPKRPGQTAFGVKGNTMPNITPGRAFFLTDDLSYATYFARNGVVSEFRATLDAVIDLHNEDNVFRLLAIYNQDRKILDGEGAWNEDLEGDIFDSVYRLLESPDVMRTILEDGFKAAFLPEDIEMGVASYAIIDNSCIEFVRILKEEKPSPSISIGL